jgi:hypothetical protein
MQTLPEQFINWLEGYFDASKNKITTNQVKEIRKKITEYRSESRRQDEILWNVSAYNVDAQLAKTSTDFHNHSLNEEYLNEIEKNKNAATMSDLI